MADELAVWLYGECVATIDRKRGRPRLAYSEEALGPYDLGTRRTSRCSIPRRPI